MLTVIQGNTLMQQRLDDEAEKECIDIIDRYNAKEAKEKNPVLKINRQIGGRTIKLLRKKKFEVSVHPEKVRKDKLCSDYHLVTTIQKNIE